jgi:hypothetical protein
MKTEEIKMLKIEIDGSDADSFKTAIKKITEQETRAGFNSSVLNADENQIIKNIFESINK